MNFNMIFIEDGLEFLLLLYSVYIAYMFWANDKTFTLEQWYSEGDNAFYEILGFPFYIYITNILS